MSGSATEKRCFVLTITVSHLHWAAVVADTLARCEPDTDVLIFVTDIRQSVLDANAWPVGAKVQLLGGDRLEAAGFATARHYFNGLEMSGPSKIYGLEHAIFAAGYDKAIFLDADIHATGDFSLVWDALDRVCSVVTPHVSSPLPADGQAPDDLEIVSYGLVNGGFWGVSRKPELPEIIAYMKRNVLRYGFFLPGPMSWAAEQTWMSALPAMFPHAVHVLRDPGLNLAYWNLHERQLSERGGRVFSNDSALVFLHLSGFRPEQGTRLTAFDVRQPDAQQAQVLAPILRWHGEAVTGKKQQMGPVAVDFPCSTGGIRARLQAYRAVHGRAHPLATRIVLAALAYKVSNVISRIAGVARR